MAALLLRLHALGALFSDAAELPCLDAATTVRCDLAMQRPRTTAVHVAFRGDSFRGLSYGAPGKLSHACGADAEAIQAATARAQLMFLVEPFEDRGVRVDVSLHTYACGANASRLADALVAAYRAGDANRTVSLRLLERRGSNQGTLLRSAAEAAAGGSYAAALLWRFDVVPSAELRDWAPGLHPFVAYAGDWALQFPGWFAACAAAIFRSDCVVASTSKFHGMLACTCRSNVQAALDAAGGDVSLENAGCANPTGCRAPPGELPRFAVYRDDFTHVGAATCRFLEGLGGPPCLDPVAAKQRACARVAAAPWPRACAPKDDEAGPRDAMVCARGWRCRR